MEEFLTIKEHKEFAKRMEDEHTRQNHRISDLEEATRENKQLLISVEKLAISTENIQKELTEQGKRLDVMEARDGEMWRKVVSHGITVLIGIFVGYILKQIGIF